MTENSVDRELALALDGMSDGWEFHGIRPDGDNPTVDVVIGGDLTAIDEEIAPLVKAIADAGMVTISSCQRGLGGKAVIDFDSVEDAATFLSIAARDFSLEVESLWNRIFVEREPETWQHFRRERIWSVSASVQDYAVEYDADATGDEVLVHRGPAIIDFRIGVAFPPSDIPTLVELVRTSSAGGPAPDA